MQFDQAKGNETPDGRLRPEIVEELGEKYAMVTLSRKSDGNFHHFSQEISDCLMNISVLSSPAVGCSVAALQLLTMLAAVL